MSWLTVGWWLPATVRWWMRSTKTVSRSIPEAVRKAEKLKEKTYVEDIDRSMYDFRNEEKDAYRVKEGLTPAIVEQISREKHDPVWMQNFRLQSLQIYNEMEMPDWGPSIKGLNMENIVTYVRPNTHMSAKWSDVPEDIKDTFEKLGIPQAERKSLAGVGAQYDSELVYHNVRAEVAAQGVVYTDMESALTRRICRHGAQTFHEAGTSRVTTSLRRCTGQSGRAVLLFTYRLAYPWRFRCSRISG